MMAEWNELSAIWTNAMFRVLWQGSLTIAFIWGLTKLWPSLPAPHRHWLWRLAYIKLAMLTLWHSSIAVPLLPAPSPSVPSPRIAQQSVGLSRIVPSPNKYSQIIPARKPATEINRALATSTESHANALVYPSWQSVLFLCWVFGVCLFLWQSSRRCRATVRLKREAEPTSASNLNATLSDLCRMLKLKRQPSLLRHPDIPSPLVIGCLNPSIIVPQTSSLDSHSQTARLILFHELLHIKRKDLWWVWLRIFVESITFFHPLIWLARRQWLLSQEMACDETVVTQSQITAPSYCQTLLELLEQSHQQKNQSPHLLAIGASGSFRDMKERLIAMNHIRSHSTPYRVGVAALIALIALAGIAPYHLVAKAPSENNKPTASSSDTSDSEKNKNKAKNKKKNKEASSSFSHAHANAGAASADSRAAIGQFESDDATASPIIQGLATALKSSQPGVRTSVVRALSELEDPDTIPVLIQALQDPNENVRHEALHGLEEFDDPRTVAAIADLLQSDSWKIRHQALDVLENFSHPQAEQHLINALQDPHHKNRLKAIDALENHQGEQTIAALAKSLHDANWRVRKEAADVLGDCDSQLAVEPLLEALQDSHPQVREEVLESLEELNIPELDIHLDQFEHNLAIDTGHFGDLFGKLHGDDEHGKRHRELMEGHIQHIEQQTAAAERQAAAAAKMAAAVERREAAEHLTAAAQRRAADAARRAESRMRAAESAFDERQQQARQSGHEFRDDFGHFPGTERFGEDNRTKPSGDEIFPSDAAIQSIVDSVLSRVNAQVEEAITKAMKEMNRANENNRKSGLDPFADDSAPHSESIVR